jgi:hypothetical protein
VRAPPWPQVGGAEGGDLPMTVERQKPAGEAGRQRTEHDRADRRKMKEGVTR